MGKRLLIISHNIIDESNNVGKTVISMLRKWPQDDVFSVYFRNEIRKTMLCNSSYMITDKDVLKSVFKRNASCGRVVNPSEGATDVVDDKAAYRFGNRRYPVVSLIRDDVWHLQKWKTEELKNWIEEIKPDLIFFVPNDYTLAFEIALYIKKLTSVPMLTFFTDDAFYFGQKIHGIEKIRRKRLRTLGKNIIKQSSCIFTASDLMRKEYKKVFGVDSTVIGNCVEISDNNNYHDDWLTKEKVVFSYIGNLHSNRWKSLIELGDCLQVINNEKKTRVEIDVYTASDLPSGVVKQINDRTTIVMKGSIPPQKVKEVQENSDALLHIEAFDEKSKKSTRLSMSTKIFEYMAREIPIFAYGPSDIASIDFLHSNNYAATCSNKGELRNSLEDFITNSTKRNNSATIAYQRAKGCFDEEYISSKVYKILNSLLPVEAD